MAAITLQPVSENDIPTLQKLALPTWEATYLPILTKEQVDFMYAEIYSETGLKCQMQAGQEFFFIQEADEPKGFLSVSLINAEEQRYKLNKIYLLSESQGTGLGRKALDLAMAYVKSLGGKVLELNVNRFNSAQHFYQKCGFTVVREVDIPFGKFWMNDFVLEKQIA